MKNQTYRQSTGRQAQEPQNRAGILPSDSLEEATAKHNRNVTETLQRAKNGKVICLTDLFSDLETVIEKAMDKEPQGGLSDEHPPVNFPF